MDNRGLYPRVRKELSVNCLLIDKTTGKIGCKDPQDCFHCGWNEAEKKRRLDRGFVGWSHGHLVKTK